MRTRRNARAPKGAPTSTNLDTMWRYLHEGNGKIPLRLDAGSVTHLRRCLDAGLLELSPDKKYIRATEEGQRVMEAYQASLPPHLQTKPMPARQNGSRGRRNPLGHDAEILHKQLDGADLLVTFGAPSDLTAHSLLRFAQDWQLIDYASSELGAKRDDLELDYVASDKELSRSYPGYSVVWGIRWYDGAKPARGNGHRVRKNSEQVFEAPYGVKAVGARDILYRLKSMYGPTAAETILRDMGGRSFTTEDAIAAFRRHYLHTYKDRYGDEYTNPWEIFDMLSDKYGQKGADEILKAAAGRKHLTDSEAQKVYTEVWERPLRALRQVGPSADWVNNAWLLDGHVGGEHIVLFETDDDEYEIVYRDNRVGPDRDANEDRDVAGPFESPQEALDWFNAKARKNRGAAPRRSRSPRRARRTR